MASARQTRLRGESVKIDFIASGILSYAIPALLIIGALVSAAQIFRGHFTPVIMWFVVGIAGMLAFNFYAGQQDTQAVTSAVSQRYGLSLTDEQAKVLQKDHSYRRHGPDLTVASDHGVAKPYGSTTVSLRGIKQKVMMYEVNDLLYIGSLPKAGAADQELRELPVSSDIPSLN